MDTKVLVGKPERKINYFEVIDMDEGTELKYYHKEVK
jgi:hypothetical protein